MRWIGLICCMALPWGAYAEKPLTEEEMEAAQKVTKEMQDLAKDREFHKQMDEATRQIEEKGVDTDKMARDLGAMSPEQKQAAFQFSSCVLSGVDGEAMKDLQFHTTEYQKTLASLCNVGKVDKARQLTKEWTAEIQRTNEYKTIKKCHQQYGSSVDLIVADSYAQMGMSAKGAAKEKVCAGN